MTTAPYRSRLQREANEFDCDLYRLIERAQKLGDGARFPMEGRHQANWREIARVLRFDARPFVRGMMHNDDREATR